MRILEWMSLRILYIQIPLKLVGQQKNLPPAHQKRTVFFLPGGPVMTLPESNCLFSLVQFSCSVVSNSLWPHGLQNARVPCPSSTPGAYPNSCPSCLWWHPTISISVGPISSCLQSSPASGSFQMSQFFISGGQSIGVSVAASVLPMNIQG